VQCFRSDIDGQAVHTDCPQLSTPTIRRLEHRDIHACQRQTSRRDETGDTTPDHGDTWTGRVGSAESVG
jgi:hypothetical protein